MSVCVCVCVCQGCYVTDVEFSNKDMDTNIYISYRLRLRMTNYIGYWVISITVEDITNIPGVRMCECQACSPDTLQEILSLFKGPNKELL